MTLLTFRDYTASSDRMFMKVIWMWSPAWSQSCTCRQHNFIAAVLVSMIVW